MSTADFTQQINTIFQMLTGLSALMTSNWLLSLFLSLSILGLALKIYFLISQ